MHKLESHMEEKTKFTNINLNQIILESMPGMAYILTKKVIWLPGIKRLKKLWVFS